MTEAGGERMMLVSRMLPPAHSEDEDGATLDSAAVPVVPGIGEGEGDSASKDMLRRI